MSGVSQKASAASVAIDARKRCETCSADLDFKFSLNDSDGEQHAPTMIYQCPVCKDVVVR